MGGVEDRPLPVFWEQNPPGFNHFICAEDMAFP